MSKMQFVLTGFAAAVPGYLLIYAMISSLFYDGMLTDDARVSTLMWIVFSVTGVGAILIGFLPFAVVVFPGLYPKSVDVAKETEDSNSSKGLDAENELDDEDFGEQMEDDDTEGFDEDFDEDFDEGFNLEEED